MKEIPLTNSPLVALVDDEDYELLADERWRLHSDGCASRSVRIMGVKFDILMHRVIMNAPDAVEVDHKNRNPLDNWKENLRLATHSQNQHNRAKNKGSRSRFKGVSWHKLGNCWQAAIMLNRKSKYLGLFTSEEDAAAAYNNAARQLHGDFARLNPISGEMPVKSD